MATSPEDIAFRQVLHEKYLEPVMTQDQYKAHLESLSRGILVQPLYGLPILLFSGELPEEEGFQFIRWVYRILHIISMTALRSSADSPMFALN